MTDNTGNIVVDEFDIHKPQRTWRSRRLNTYELLLIPGGTINTKTKNIEGKLNNQQNINVEPEEVQEVQVQPIENNAVNYILLAIAEPQPIRRTERARNASDRLNLRLLLRPSIIN